MTNKDHKPVKFSPEVRQITKKYSNGEITVVWKPSLCTHSKVCWKGLPEVFNPEKRPWITPSGSTTEKITDQVNQCPSGALSYFHHTTSGDAKEPERAKETSEGSPAVRVQLMDDGPLIIFGDILVKDASGNEVIRKRVTSFCRCGLSKVLPYCDGAHNQPVKKAGSSGLFGLFKK